MPRNIERKFFNDYQKYNWSIYIRSQNIERLSIIRNLFFWHILILLQIHCCCVCQFELATEKVLLFVERLPPSPCLKCCTFQDIWYHALVLQLTLKFQQHLEFHGHSSRLHLLNDSCMLIFVLFEFFGPSSRKPISDNSSKFLACFFFPCQFFTVCCSTGLPIYYELLVWLKNDQQNNK